MNDSFTHICQKLCQLRPSTAPIGNWGILQGLTKLSTEYTGTEILIF